MIQLQSILLPTKEVCDIPELYYHKKGCRIDFDGYFNLFYLEKRKKYTGIKNLSLSVCLQGYEKLIVLHDGKELGDILLDARTYREYKIEFPYEKFQKGVFWFALIEDREIEQRCVKGFFVSEPDPEACRRVHIGIDICTFKREEYVARNLKQMKEMILDKKELDVSDHIKIYIIDNGKSLSGYKPVQDLIDSSSGRAAVISNKNAGGAGGFTRGMLEILKERDKERFTHVLLMDDDAVVEPDTLVRIYGLASTLKEEWKDMTIGGAMLREDYPYMLFCAGEWWEKGRVQNPEKNLDLRNLQTASCSYLTETGHEFDRYSGWWCCCYSLNTVREDNLPLPLFIHHDDIEFCLRNLNQGITFLNGIGVWHRGIEVTFPGTNFYYDIRNLLIEIALHQDNAQKKTAGIILLKALTSSAFRLNLRDIVLIYRGLVDFLRGPEWLCLQDPELLHDKIRKLAHKMYPMDQLKKSLTDREYASAIEQIQKYEESFGINTIIDSRTRKSKCSLLHIFTYNGWILPSDKADVKVIFPTDSPFDAFRKKKVIFYEPASRKAMLLVRKYRIGAKMIFVQIKAWAAFAKGFDKAVENYKTNVDKVTNRKAWEAYLEER
ncbi:glycosyltransferase [Lachnospiraceae bacterium 62-35]